MVEVLRIICNEQLLTCLGQYDALPTCEVQYYTSTLTKTLTRLELRREFSLRNKKNPTKLSIISILKFLISFWPVVGEIKY